MKKQILRLCLLILIMQCVLSCRPVKVSDMYYFGFVNRTENSVSSLKLHVGKNLLYEPELVIGSSATDGPYPPPIPKQIKIDWSDLRTNYEVLVSLDKIVPPQFHDGTIFFILNKDGSIVVEPRHFSDK